MKIAVVTDDGKTISQHFGRALYYLVYNVENGAVTAKETRPKAAHHTPGEEHHREGGHSGPEADAAHGSMLSNIRDCKVLIARGMGYGAHEALTSAGIEPYITDINLADEAVKAYTEGKLDSHTERLH